MQDTGVTVGHVGLDGNQAQCVQETLVVGAATLESQAHDTAAAVGKVFGGQFVAPVSFQAGIVHPGHLGAVLQPGGHLQGALAVAADPQVQGLQAQMQVKGVLGALGAAQVPHQMGDDLGNVGRLAELFGIGEPVIGLVRGGEAGEFVGMAVPGEVAAVHDGPAYAHALSVYVFGGGVGDNVGPPFEGTAEHGRGKGVVNHQGNAAFMGDARPFLQVQHLYAGVGEGFAEQKLGPGAEGGPDFVLPGVRVYERDVYAELLQRGTQQVERAAVDVVGGDDVVSRPADIQAGHQIGRLSGRGEDGAYTAFQVADLGGHAVTGGILEPGIEVAAVFQVEQAGHLLGGVVFERRALDDGELPGFSFSGMVTCVDAARINGLHKRIIFLQN